MTSILAFYKIKRKVYVMSGYVVELKDVTKKFPGVVALKHMSIGLEAGKIHGLIGENGAGKSTLIKVLTGVNIPEEGSIYVCGKQVKFKNPVQAREAGIACVYQELNIVPQLPVVDNVFMGRAIKKGTLLNYEAMEKIASAALRELGHPEIDVKMECGKLGVGQQQMVEIAKALSIDAKLIIMDEPTSSLGKDEITQLMATVRKLKDKGIAILFVSHKLEELFELCDRVTVMRDGEHIVTDEMSNMTEDKLINAMVGRTLDNLYPKEYGTKGPVWFEAKHVNEIGILKDVSFTAHAGQITGFAGLVGAGRTETMRAIFGADKIDSGEIYIKGEKVSIKKPKDAIKAKVAFLTEDRKGQGLVLSLATSTNLILANMKKYCDGIFFNQQRIDDEGKKNVQALRIKIPTLETPTVQLSGGNQQKVVIAKWMNSNADIYIFDEPTRGIDVGAKIEVYKVMNQLVKEGKCIIMVSSELPEILAMSDKVVVMRSGKVMAEIERGSEHFNSEDIMKAAWGGEI